MNSSIRAWGNSQGIYIPKKILKEAAMELNEAVELKVVDGGIMICKDESRDRAIRPKQANAADAKEKDHRAEFEEYLDERYGK